jgi:hypothetical protein
MRAVQQEQRAPRPGDQRPTCGPASAWCAAARARRWWATRRQVAARIKEYAALGLEYFVLSGYPHLEEALPLRRAGVPAAAAQAAREAAGAALTGPFGEIVANSYAPRRAEGGMTDGVTASAAARRATCGSAVGWPARPTTPFNCGLDPQPMGPRAPCALLPWLVPWRCSSPGNSPRAAAGCPRACCPRRGRCCRRSGSSRVRRAVDARARQRGRAPSPASPSAAAWACCWAC